MDFKRARNKNNKANINNISNNNINKNTNTNNEMKINKIKGIKINNFQNALQINYNNNKFLIIFPYFHFQNFYFI